MCPSVCLLPRFLRLHTTRRKNSDTITTLGSFLKRRFSYNYCVQKLWREKQVNKPILKFVQGYLDRVRLLCVPWRRKKSQRRRCIDSRMLSTTVARLSTIYQRETTSKRILITTRGIAHAQLAEGFALYWSYWMHTIIREICTDPLIRLHKSQ